MCRKKTDDTGRRCPSHTEPELIEQRNEVRREQYAMKKTRDKTAVLLAESGITFHRGDAVKNEFFQGQEAYDPEKFQAVKDPTPIPEQETWGLKAFFQSKPADGGLWTSPGYTGGDGGIKTEWTDWSHHEGYRVTNNPMSPLVVKKQAVIVEINTEEELQSLCKAFPRPAGGFSYESLASAGVDGVRLTQAGLRNAKRAGLDEAMHNFSNWDIDSTVWLSKDSISTGKEVKKAYYEPVERDEYNYYDDESDDTEGDGNSWDFLDELVARANIAEAEERKSQEQSA